MNLAPYLEDFGPFTIGDAPVGVFLVEFTEPGGTTAVPLPDDALVSVFLVSPLGGRWVCPVVLPEDGSSVGQDGAPVIVEYPAALEFLEDGLWTLQVRVDGQTIRPFRFVVQAIDGWHSLDTARDEWPDANTMADAALYRLLGAAREQIEAFAPLRLTEGFPPSTWLQAQLMQARALARSMVAQSGDQIGEGDFAITVYPLDHVIRALIRPKRGTPGRM